MLHVDMDFISILALFVSASVFFLSNARKSPSLVSEGLSLAMFGEETESHFGEEGVGQNIFGSGVGIALVR